MTRREQVRQTTRDRIFEAARSLVIDEGAGAVTIRRLAAEIDYSAPVIYQHFADKAAVLDAVMADAYEWLAARMRESARGDATKAVRRVMDAYLDFAEEQPLLYLFINGVGGVELSPARRRLAAAPVAQVTNEAIAAWASTEADVHTSGSDDECETIWALASGMAGIGMLDDVGFDRARRLAGPALEAILASWRTGGGR